MSGIFDRVAWGYPCFMRFWGLFREREVLELLQPQPGDRIVDLGGGTGQYARILAPHCREVLVVDESPRMLNKVPRGEGIRTLCADVLRTALPGAQADAVLLCDVLHHLTDQPALIAETLRLVRPGGKLLIYDFDRSHPLTRVVETFESVFLPPVMFQTAGGIEALLSEAGWTPFHTRVEGPLFFGLWRAP